MVNFLTTWLLNAQGDLELDGINRFKQVEGEQKVVQDIRILLQTQRGSDILDREFGFDSMVVIERPTTHVIGQTLSEAISGYRFSESVDDIVIGLDRATRTLNLTVTITISENPTVRTSVVLGVNI